MLIVTGDATRYLIETVSDEAHGAYVVWNEYTGTAPGEPVTYTIIVQHINGDGQVATGWPATGRPVTTASPLEVGWSALADGAGGVIVSWADSRSALPSQIDDFPTYADIWATRFLADGRRAPGWADAGTPVAIARGEQRTPMMCVDGTGGALFAWSDNRTSYGQLYANRILGTGERAPGWPENGALVADNSAGSEFISLASDAMHGAYIGWNNNVGVQRAFAQHFRGDGTLAPGWATFGTLMVDIASSTQSFVSVVPAEPGSAYIVWEDIRYVDSLQSGVRAQKLVGDGPVPVQLALVTATASTDAVQLEWRGDRAAFAGARVERSRIDGAWQPLGAPANEGADILRYEDRAIVAGARYAYRLVDAGDKVLVAPTWVDVPSATRFALAGATPNPSRAGDLAVRFSLPVRAGGTLELLDLAGRRRAYRELGVMEPGEHLERMAETAGFAPGLYWLRLQQGGMSATQRVVLTP